MKRKSLALLLGLAILLGAAAIPAAAAPQPGRMPGREERTEQMAKIKERFAALTDAQKAQIYKQHARVMEQAEKLLQDYADLGVISKEDAAYWMEAVRQWSQRAQQAGEPVGIPNPRGFCPNAPPEQPGPQPPAAGGQPG